MRRDTARPSSPPKPLARDAIVASAIALTEREGPQALTMRRLGGDLGVEAMAIYHHVPSRDALLGLMADRLMEPLRETPIAGDWRESCRAFATTLRAIALGCPATFTLVGLRPFDTPLALRPVERLLGALVANGFGAAGALAVYRVVASYARGYALAEAGGFTVGASDSGAVEALATLAPAEFPVLSGRSAELGALDPDATFQLGLGVLVAGLPEPG
jgi:AcrR family transcriptional regulator